jgi:D-alanine--poly(phosphoribitol) ligase subunit 2
MRVEKEVISNIVKSAVEQANTTLPPEGRLEPSASTLLTGDGGALSSLGVITFILAVEERVNEACSTEIVLFDESLIADPDGPFRTLGALMDHVHSAVQKT